MDKEKISNVIKCCDGLSYHDWQKVKMVVDKTFRTKKIKHERELKLDSCDDLVNSILRQFE